MEGKVFEQSAQWRWLWCKTLEHEGRRDEGLSLDKRLPLLQPVTQLVGSGFKELGWREEKNEDERGERIGLELAKTSGMNGMLESYDRRGILSKKSA